jgi:hypothetical protein
MTRRPGCGGGGTLADSTAPVVPTAMAATMAPPGISASQERRERTATPSATSSSTPAAMNPA